MFHQIFGNSIVQQIFTENLVHTDYCDREEGHKKEINSPSNKSLVIFGGKKHPHFPILSKINYDTLKGVKYSYDSRKHQFFLPSIPELN